MIMAERQSERKQRRILEEAERLFLALGLRAASVEEIAAAAGVSKVTLYRHYGTKDDLFVECVRRITNRHYAELETVIASQETAASKLASVFRHNIESRSRYQPAFIRDMHLGHTTRLVMSFGDIVPRLYPYDDEREAERFLQSLYDFLTAALTHR